MVTASSRPYPHISSTLGMEVPSVNAVSLPIIVAAVIIEVVVMLIVPGLPEVLLPSARLLASITLHRSSKYGSACLS